MNTASGKTAHLIYSLWVPAQTNLHTWYLHFEYLFRQNCALDIFIVNVSSGISSHLISLMWILIHAKLHTLLYSFWKSAQANLHTWYLHFEYLFRECFTIDSFIMNISSAKSSNLIFSFWIHAKFDDMKDSSMNKYKQVNCLRTEIVG